MAKLVSETYGEALFSLGLEKGSGQPYGGVDALRGILEENPGFSRLMNHPDIGRDEAGGPSEGFEGKLSGYYVRFSGGADSQGPLRRCRRYFYLLYGQI